jgi:hypothetical protein
MPRVVAVAEVAKLSDAAGPILRYSAAPKVGTAPRQVAVLEGHAGDYGLRGGRQVGKYGRIAPPTPPSIAL